MSGQAFENRNQNHCSGTSIRRCDADVGGSRAGNVIRSAYPLLLIARLADGVSLFAQSAMHE
jgi:hypothetical protein